jgi:dTMP kinase
MSDLKLNGVFLSVEGIEGVGKSTVVKYIAEYLTLAAREVILTREPGGTKIAESIRQILLDPNIEEKINPDTELLLMFACRSQLITQVIQPALQAGKWVISDRFVDASYAYQGGGRKMNVSHIQMLDQWIVNELKPKVTILLDAPPSLGLARAKNRGPHDRIEQEKVDFFERVRMGYLQQAKADSKRFRIIDATQPLKKVQHDIKYILDELLHER